MFRIKLFLILMVMLALLTVTSGVALGQSDGLGACLKYEGTGSGWTTIGYMTLTQCGDAFSLVASWLPKFNGYTYGYWNVNGFATDQYFRFSEQSGILIATNNGSRELQWQPWSESAPHPSLQRPKFNVIVIGCDTGLDVFNQMGEVTNAWVTVQNVGNAEASNVNLTLYAQDEERGHPDKNKFIHYLPPDHEISLKLTVDTAFGTDTYVWAEATSSEGVSEQGSRPSCRALDENARSIINVLALGAVQRTGRR